MGKAFFTGWALWEQMTFVLACGIVATICAGLVKLRYDHWKIKKYTKVEKGKTTQTPEMLEAQRLAEDPKDEIPFGVRAIERGLEVDGVWISRTNTPVGSSRSSMTDVRLPRSYNTSQLELPRAIHAGSGSRESSRAPSSAFDRAVSAERLPYDSRASSPGQDNTYAHGRPPISYNNPNVTRNSATLQALEGSSAGYYNPEASSSNTGKSSRASDESDDLNLRDSRPYETAYVNHGSLGVPGDPRTDLDLLQSHRLSHVAETGQLTPRTRRPGQSGEWTSVAENALSPNQISTSNGVDYFVPQQKTPSPPPALTGPTDPYAGAYAGPYSSNYNQDGHSSNQARQAVPLLETYAPQAYQPRGPQHQYYEEPAQFDAPQNERESQVIRKVNSGFEILRPGTLGEPTSPEDDRPDKRQSKRLQKRRKSSGGSKTSQFVEQI